MAELGSRIRRQRRLRRMSQTDLAGSDLSHSYISLLESGKRTPSEEVLRRIAARLECDPGYLLECLASEPPGNLEVEISYAEMSLANGEPEAALTTFLAAREKAGDGGPAEVRSAVGFGVARSLEALGRLEEALVEYERLREAGTDHQGQPASAVADLTVVIALCRCYRELGDLAHAVELAESKLADLQRLEIPPSVTAIELMSTLVGLYSERGDLNRAGYLAARAIEEAEQLTDSRARGAAYWNASLVAHRNGRAADALTFVRKALALYAEGEDQRAMARLRNAYAVVLLDAETPDAAAAKQQLTLAEQELDRHGSTVDQAYCQTAMARADLALDDSAAAADRARSALNLLGTGHRLQSARALLVLARAELRQGHAERARAACERAALSLEASEATRQAGFAWAELAETQQASGDERGSLASYRESLRCLGYRSSTVPAAEPTPAAAEG
ncbi:MULTISPECIES: helix-turn-helix domain-containing protein [unclassified Streptomyces]|uniref:helix-turn-helix domain-containing protein n=1 Tax=unclassified Streptomyces TaxID=2593676 RepID=UPI000B82BC4E|nr:MULTISPECIES: helix-turn-helix transcriptional regulator [unclassified Streptomyces]